MPTRATWRNPLGTVQSLENVYGDTNPLRSSQGQRWQILTATLSESSEILMTVAAFSLVSSHTLRHISQLRKAMHAITSSSRNCGEPAAPRVLRWLCFHHDLLRSLYCHRVEFIG